MALDVLCVVVFAVLMVSLQAAPVDKEPGFVEEQGKALKYFKGTKRDDVELGKAEKEAGKAVLKLLDAKIGSKVKQAASEVTDFLNGAIGKHAQARSEKLRTDKEKEISLIHLGTENAVKQQDKGKKKKDDSFLIHFKVPYVVTPIKKKHSKKYHGHHGHHGHHHRHLHHHDAKHHPSTFHPYKPPPNPPPHRPVVHPAPSPYGQRPPQQQGVAGQQPYSAINLNYNGNGWTYSVGNETAASVGMEPCQGSCIDPCSEQCSLNQGCCCCPSNSAASSLQMEAPAPQYLQYPPAPPPQPAAVAPASPASSCPPACGNNCFSYCPQSCCGVMGKRTQVPAQEGSGSEHIVTEESDDSDENDADETPVDQDDKEEDSKATEAESGDSETGNDSENNKETEEISDEV